MATVPTLLYYLAVFLMIEIDAKKMGTREVRIDAVPMKQLLRKRGYHFTSLFIVIALMAAGLTPIFAVFWSIVAAILLSFLDRENALYPRRLGRSLESGSLGVLSVAATTATAGIIVGITTLTGLGLKISGIIVSLAGGSLFLTLIYTCIAVWLLGLAVPVTASYIIAAVMTVPAMTQLGVPDFAAHMFIFYYAVLSEVSPPTALSPFAAAAITGGNPYRTTMLAWKYTLVAFIVPFMFTLDPAGIGLLLRGDVLNMVVVGFTAAVGIIALVAGVGGWLLRPTNVLERALLIAGGLVLIYPAEPWGLLGLTLSAAAAVVHILRTRRGEPSPAGA
jgi:TRAP transporter 4TM/12TM fusion protein